MPDRPGALGLVASRIGSVRGDIVGIRVLEQGHRVVVDEFAVDLPDGSLLPVMRREIEEVDGASVEQVRIVRHLSDPRLDALDTAARLCEADSEVALHNWLVAMVQTEYLANWTVLSRAGALLASIGTVPGGQVIDALVHGDDASASVESRAIRSDDLVVAKLPSHEATLLIGRVGQPFRALERNQILALVRIADRVWTLLAP